MTPAAQQRPSGRSNAALIVSILALVFGSGLLANMVRMATSYGQVREQIAELQTRSSRTETCIESLTDNMTQVKLDLGIVKTDVSWIATTMRAKQNGGSK